MKSQVMQLTALVGMVAARIPIPMAVRLWWMELVADVKWYWHFFQTDQSAEARMVRAVAAICALWTASNILQFLIFKIF